MTNMCRAEFPGSRMCTVAEAQGTLVPPSVPDGWLAWVRDAEPQFDTCTFWTEPRSVLTRILTWQGAVDNSDCTQRHHVSCCVPCVVGDVDGDGKVTSIDARLIQRAAVGLIPPGALRCSPPLE